MDTDVYPKSARADRELGFRSRCRDRGVRHRRCGRGGRGRLGRRRRPRPRAHRRMGRRGRDGGRIHLPRWRHRNPKSLWFRRFRRQHGRVPQRGDGAGRRREPRRRLLRRQRRPFRLAGALRRPVQTGVLGRAGLGAARRRRPDVHRRRERLPVQHHRQTRSARATFRRCRTRRPAKPAPATC